ncbi:MAG: hypothetical protein RQ743_08100 [Bacteroidales bacterium]|nr:hypothetical protein [Bacteroidales bacterium]
MVTIIDYTKRKNKEGKEFNALILQGGIELVKSKETDNYYATAKRTSITSTFDDKTCEKLIGTEIPGSIKKMICDPYEYTIDETGEIITLSHQWVYLKEGETLEEKIMDEKVEKPSMI